jgi:hypothetical protein
LDLKTEGSPFQSLPLRTKSPKRVSRILGVGNEVRASTVDHAQKDREPLARSKTTNTVTESSSTKLAGRRTLAVRQFSLCGWEAATSQGRQAHWRGKLAASDREFKVPTDEFSWINDFARRAQIQWHTRVACPCFPVLLANQIRPVRRVRWVSLQERNPSMCSTPRLAVPAGIPGPP